MTRIDEIRSKLFRIQSLMADLQQKLLELKHLGCTAALKYTQVNDLEGELELVHRIDDPPPVETQLETIPH